MTEKVLYGFAAREIQKFILRSDKLREMAGGSELVNQLCRDFLEAGLAGLGIPNDAVEPVTRAAGWARLVFENMELARRFHEFWPLLVEQCAPGLHVDQAFVPLNANGWVEAVEKLEDALRVERNQGQAFLPEAGPLVGRNPGTGLPAAEYSQHIKQWVDCETSRKLALSKTGGGLVAKLGGDPEKEHWPLDMKDIASSESNYVAVVHADGNDLGKIVMDMNKFLQESDIDGAVLFKGFSAAVEQATWRAARKAFEATIRPEAGRDEKTKPVIPFRPIVLGGDDLTVIVRAQLGFAFCEEFLKNFERESETALEEQLGKLPIPGFPERLTAAAGIALVKSAYPFSRAYDLADSLCRHAKLRAKALIKRASQEADRPMQSCLAFHKVTTSIAGDYGEIQKEELASRDRSVSLWLGPYGVGDNAPSLPSFDNLRELAQSLRGLHKGPFRRLLTTLYESSREAEASLERIKEVMKATDKGAERFNSFQKNLGILTGGGILDGQGNCPLLEAMTLAEMIERPEE